MKVVVPVRRPAEMNQEDAGGTNRCQHFPSSGDGVVSREKDDGSASNLSADEIYSELGELGLWQWIGMVALWSGTFSPGLIILSSSYVGLQPKSFVCLSGVGADSTSNLSCQIDQSLIAEGMEGGAFFRQPEDHHGNNAFDFCQSKPLKTPAAVLDTHCQFDYSSPDFPNRCDLTEPNTTIFYGKFDMENSIATDFNLVCGENYKVALAGSIFMLGLCLGSGIGGKMSDHFGRKKTLLVLLLIGAISQVICGLTHTYNTYLAARFLSAIGASAVLPSLVMSMEIVGSKHRTFASLLANVPFALGEATAAGIAYLARDWRTFQFVSSVPLFAWLIVAYFLAPESPRWLLAEVAARGAAARNKRRHEAAGRKLKLCIEKMAKINKTRLSEKTQQKLDQMLESVDKKADDEKQENSGKRDDKCRQGEEKKGVSHNEHLEVDDEGEQIGLVDVIKHRSMRTSLIVMFCNWMIVTLGYYGLSMVAIVLGDDVFSSGALIALVEIPSYVFCWLFIDRLGRKPICMLAFLLTGITCTLAAFVTGPFQIALAATGKFGNTAAFSIVFLYAAELFPTKVRSRVMGMCSMSARIGGFLAPQVVLFLPTLVPAGGRQAPMMVMATCSLLAAFLTLALPESLGSLTVQTVKDVEDLRNGGGVAKPFFAYWSSRKLKSHLDQLTEQRRKPSETTHLQSA